MKIQNGTFNNNFGFTLLELLMVIVIFTILTFSISYFFDGFNKKEFLEKDVASLTALVRDARMLSVASKNASPFGVHFEADRAVLFEGSSYVAGGANEKIILFSKNVYLFSYSLNGGGVDVVFNRLIGDTDNYGSVTLSLKDDSASTTVTILRTGVIQ